MLRFLQIFLICIKWDLGRFIALKNLKRWRLGILALGLPLLTLKLAGRAFRISGKKQSREKSLRLALEELGPIFIKFGQILSTRADLLPPALTEQLSYLQDRVAPHPTKEIVAVLEESLGGKVSKFFKEFDNKSCASASIAQVHFGVLRQENKSVAIKVVKPGIEKKIAQDVKFLYQIAGLITETFANSERLHLKDIVREFEYVLEHELNMQQEGANASQLKRNFSSAHDSQLMQVPEIYWNYTSEKVLVMERIRGVAINDVATFKKHNIDLRALAEKGVKIFFTQVFRDSFFHADMHPGNIFVDISDPRNPVYKGVDFGIMGSLSLSDRKYLALNLLAFLSRDYRRVAELHINCGWVSRDTRVEQLEAAVRGVCEPIFAKPLNEIPFGQVLGKLIKTAKRFNMQVQPQLLLLQKTLINVEGLGHQLYPQLNIWDTATPILKKWLADEVGVRNLISTAKEVYPELLVRLPRFVDNLATALEKQSAHPADFIKVLPGEIAAERAAEQKPSGASKEEIAQLKRKLHTANVLAWATACLAALSAAIVVSLLG